MEAKSQQEIFDAWFDHLQALHAQNPERHPNQVPYDLTLKDNYPWVFWNLKQTDVPLVCHDIGCAYGTMSLGAYTLGYKTYAFDCIDTWVNRPALDQRGVEFQVHDIAKAPVDAPFADAVIFTEVLEHLNTNPINALLNIRERMKPGGLLILSTPRREAGAHTAGLYQEGHKESSNTPNVEVKFGPFVDWKDIPLEIDEPWIDAHMYVYTQREVFEMLDMCGFNVLTTGIFWNGLSFGVIAYANSGPTDLFRMQAEEYVLRWQAKD